MTHLIVLSRDAVVYPTQNKNAPYGMHPDVARKLAHFRNQRYNIAIASNEGSGAWERSTAKKLAVGAQFRMRADRWFCDAVHTAKSITIGRRGNILNVEYECDRSLLGPEEPILMRNKTIESTINEIKTIANLCGIAEAVFCPVTDGKLLYSIRYEKGWPWRSRMVARENCWMPGSGMLTYLKSQQAFTPSRCVLIGETADQNFAADLARFDFVYAEDWRNDRVKV